MASTERLVNKLNTVGEHIMMKCEAQGPCAAHVLKGFWCCGCKKLPGNFPGLPFGG